MAKKTTAPDVKPAAYRPDFAVKRLRDVSGRLKEAAKKGSITSEEMGVLRLAVEDVLTKTWGENHTRIHDIVGASPRVRSIVLGGVNRHDYDRDRAEDANYQAKLIDELASQIEADLPHTATPAPATAASKSDIALAKVISVVERFHRVARQLRVRHGNRPTISVDDEYDVQDLLHALLKIFFDDVRAEEWTPSYAGKSARMDFLLKAEQVVVETKMTRNSLGEKEVGDELIIDIARYQSHQDCRTLICFVYDPTGRIGNPEGLEKDLARTVGELVVKVIVAPRQ